MTANNTVGKFISCEARSAFEACDHASTETHTTASVVTLTSPPTGAGTYGIKYTGTVSDRASHILRNPDVTTDSTADAFGFGVLLYPDANPTDGGSGEVSHLVGWDAGSLGGVNVGWAESTATYDGISITANELVLCAQGTATVLCGTGYIWDASSPEYIWVELSRNSTSGRITLRIYEFSAGVITTTPAAVCEILNTSRAAVMSAIFRWGQTAGTAYCEFTHTNWYILTDGGGDDTVPLFPKMAVDTVSAVSSNATQIVSSGGVDHGTTPNIEATEIDETPGAAVSDADYIKKTNTELAVRLERYTLNNVSAGGANILAVGVTARGWSNNTSLGITNAGAMYLSGSRIGDVLKVVRNSADSATANVWQYGRLGCWSSTKPGGGAWTQTDVDNLEYEARMRTSATTPETRNSQAMVHIAYGDNEAWRIKQYTSGYQITAVAPDFVPKVMMIG